MQPETFLFTEQFFYCVGRESRCWKRIRTFNCRPLQSGFISTA
jgi:hypothetical protein